VGLDTRSRPPHSWIAWDNSVLHLRVSIRQISSGMILILLSFTHPLNEEQAPFVLMSTRTGFSGYVQTFVMPIVWMALICEKSPQRFHEENAAHDDRLYASILSGMQGCNSDHERCLYALLHACTSAVWSCRWREREKNGPISNTNLDRVGPPRHRRWRPSYPSCRLASCSERWIASHWLYWHRGPHGDDDVSSSSTSCVYSAVYTHVHIHG
jgi:hypothetical protein